MTGRQEQDLAAGGPARRELRLTDGTVVVASVAARRYRRTPNQCYGYLQFKAHGKTVTKYIGRVTAETKEESLRLGWDLLHTRNLAEANGWAWVTKPRKK
ncbi:MAG: hypothetical protein AB7S53_06365 [Thiomonas sp.]